MTTESRISEEHGLISNRIAAIALVVSLVSLGISGYEASQANSISEQALKITQAAVPQLALQAHIEGSSTSESTPGKSAKLNVIYELDNTGDVPLHACSTEYQYTTLEGEPIMYWPSVVEPGGEKWSLAAGEVHESHLSIPISVGYEITTTAYIATWFECTTRGVISSAEVLGIDLTTGKIIDNAIFGLKTLPPMGSLERANAVQTRYGRPTMPPSPTQIAPFIGSAQ